MNNNVGQLNTVCICSRRKKKHHGHAHGTYAELSEVDKRWFFVSSAEKAKITAYQSIGKSLLKKRKPKTKQNKNRIINTAARDDMALICH